MPESAQLSSAITQSHGQLNLVWVKSESDIPSELWDKCFPPPFEGRWWYSVLERAGLENQFQFYYGLLSRGQELIGIIPAFLNDVPIELVAPDAIAAALRVVSKVIPACGYQRTLFVGSPCADEGTIGLIPGVNLKDVAAFIHAQVIKQATLLQAPMIVWKDFPKTDEAALDTLCTNGNVFKMVSYPGTVIKLPQASMEVYLKSLKSSHRHNLQKKLKRSKQQFSLEASVIQNPDPQTLNEIFALFWQTYERGKTKFERLDIKFFSLISQEKPAWYVILRDAASGKPVAFMLCFLIGDRVINKFIGLDYSIARDASLYYRLWEAAMQWTVSQGVKELQSGQTGYRFKLDTGNTLIPLFNYCQNRNAFMNFIYAKVSSTISWASLDEDLRVFLEAHPQQSKSIN